jgi:hypothetical protein
LPPYECPEKSRGSLIVFAQYYKIILNSLRDILHKFKIENLIQMDDKIDDRKKGESIDNRYSITYKNTFQMKPNDKNAKLLPGERPFRVMLVAGSARREYNCPGVDSKARMLMLKMAELLPQEWEIDYEDISNTYGREKIRSCNACVSTSMALCIWPCNCYEKNSHAEPDMMCGMQICMRVWIWPMPGLLSAL